MSIVPGAHPLEFRDDVIVAVAKDLGLSESWLRNSLSKLDGGRRPT
jgi:hypothetical protein